MVDVCLAIKVLLDQPHIRLAQASAEENVSYYEAMLEIADHLNLNKDLIEPGYLHNMEPSENLPIYSGLINSRCITRAGIPNMRRGR